MSWRGSKPAVAASAAPSVDAALEDLFTRLAEQTSSDQVNHKKALKLSDEILKLSPVYPKP
jgi:hypothetical protein